MMKSLLVFAFVVLTALKPVNGYAQVGTAPAPVPAPQTLSAEQAQQALDVLQDPQKRAQLISVLQAIAKTPPAAAPAPAAPPAAKTESPVALQPHSLGAQLLVTLSGWSGQLAGE